MRDPYGAECPETPTEEETEMAKGPSGCECNCCISPAVTQQFEQTAGRYNDRSAFASNAAQDAFNNNSSMFQAQAQNALEQTPQSNLLSGIGQVLALVRGLGAPAV